MLTEGGTPFEAMQRKAPFMSRDTDVRFSQGPFHLVTAKMCLAPKVLCDDADERQCYTFIIGEVTKAG